MKDIGTIGRTMNTRIVEDSDMPPSKDKPEVHHVMRDLREGGGGENSPAAAHAPEPGKICGKNLWSETLNTGFCRLKGIIVTFVVLIHVQR